eukprot:1150802-Pelagomonas_calceolata.AAC.1
MFRAACSAASPLLGSMADASPPPSAVPASPAVAAARLVAVLLLLLLLLLLLPGHKALVSVTTAAGDSAHQDGEVRLGPQNDAAHTEERCMQNWLSLPKRRWLRDLQKRAWRRAAASLLVQLCKCVAMKALTKGASQSIASHPWLRTVLTTVGNQNEETEKQQDNIESCLCALSLSV